VQAIYVWEKYLQDYEGALTKPNIQFLAQVVNLDLMSSGEKPVLYQSLHREKVEDAVVDLLKKVLGASEDAREMLLRGERGFFL
jgi:hypothetical protein